MPTPHQSFPENRWLLNGGIPDAQRAVRAKARFIEQKALPSKGKGESSAFAPILKERLVFYLFQGLYVVGNSFRILG